MKRSHRYRRWARVIIPALSILGLAVALPHYALGAIDGGNAPARSLANEDEELVYLDPNGVITDTKPVF